MGTFCLLEVYDPNLVSHVFHVSLCHYPLVEWDRMYEGGVHLHGHSHGRLAAEPGRLDVGVDHIARLKGSYAPISLEEAVLIARGTLGA